MFKECDSSQIVRILSMMMHRLIRRMVSSSSYGDAIQGPLNGILKPYHNMSSTDIEDETEPFSLINPYLTRDSRFRWINQKPSRETLGSGMILFKNYITLMGQVDIVNMCQKWGVGPGGFYRPSNQSGAKLRLHMTCFGRNWDPVTRYNRRYRSDGSEPPPIPYDLISFVEATIEEAQFHLDEVLPSMCPDVCVANFYSPTGRLGLHQDCDESSESLRRGLPVVSISIGDSAEFWYGHIRDESKLAKVVLESGDVLVFGGMSRHIFHGVKRIIPATTSMPLAAESRLLPGRLNLTLRQSCA